MHWTVVVKKGNLSNITLATILYDKWGAKTNQTVITCESWQDGYDLARDQGYTRALFVNNGTVFTDWPTWKNLLNSYPHQGLIAHIIWPPGKLPKLHEQCWFQDIDRLKLQPNKIFEYPKPVRSEQNLHDDYTPLWIKPSNETISHRSEEFGQDLIAQQLISGLPVVNWNNQARSLKTYAYQGFDIEKFCSEYLNLSEHQLWVLNNESIRSMGHRSLICPGSGLFWIMNIVDPQTEQIHIIDISDTQIKFCQELWHHWDGQNYGSFVYQFIQDNNVKHFEVDRPDFSPLDYLKLKSSKNFIPYVNEVFHKILADAGHDFDSFAKVWKKSKQTKTISWDKKNLIHWVLENPGLKGHDYVWTSNILDYKWTLIKTSPEDMIQFRKLVK